MVAEAARQHDKQVEEEMQRKIQQQVEKQVAEKMKRLQTQSVDNSQPMSHDGENRVQDADVTPV